MITFENIGFRPVEFQDLEELKSLHNDQNTIFNLGNVELVSTEDQELWWQAIKSKGTSKRFSVVEVNLNKVIGIIKIDHLDLNNRNCEIGLDIVGCMRGRGYGKKTYNLVLSYLFNQFNINMVYLRYISTNLRAASLYKKIGFEDTGYLKDFIYRDGTFIDYKIMCLTKDRFNKVIS